MTVTISCFIYLVGYVDYVCVLCHVKSNLRVISICNFDIKGNFQ